MSSFDQKKSIEESIIGSLIITTTTTEMSFARNTANVKPPKVSLDVMDIMKLVGGICSVCEVLVKYYAVYKE